MTGLGQREKGLMLPAYGPKVPYRWLIRIDTLLLRIWNLVSHVEDAKYRESIRSSLQLSYEKTNCLSRSDLCVTSSSRLCRRTGGIFEASYYASSTATCILQTD